MTGRYGSRSTRHLSRRSPHEEGRALGRGARRSSLGVMASSATSASSETGVTARTITIGGTFPLTGRRRCTRRFPPAMKAYFSYINSRKGPDGKRGVYGRQIVFKYYDDGYNPAQQRAADAQARRAGQGVRGRRLARDRGEPGDPAVPELAEGAADPRLDGRLDVGRATAKKYPWTGGWQPDYEYEAQDLRPGDRPQQPEREDRRPVPERRLRQGEPRGPEGGAGGEGVEHRRRGGVRGRRPPTCARRSQSFGRPARRSS